MNSFDGETLSIGGERRLDEHAKKLRGSWPNRKQVPEEVATLMRIADEIDKSRQESGEPLALDVVNAIIARKQLRQQDTAKKLQAEKQRHIGLLNEFFEKLPGKGCNKRPTDCIDRARPVRATDRDGNRACAAYSDGRTERSDC
jgi:hypothetical protein